MSADLYVLKPRFEFLEPRAMLSGWTALANQAPSSSGGLMLLLSDGTVMVKSSSGGGDGYGNAWNKLTPDSHGSYANGTWSTLAPMTSTRLYFSSQVLTDGRVYVAGGEYGTGGALAEVYNPLSNTWTSTPNQGQTISDANSEILPDGRVLEALVTGTLRGTDIYNPATNTWTTGPSSNGIHNESAWVKLPDNSILFVDRLSTTSERYIPSLNQFVTDATVPVSLYDSFGDETGPGFLLPDGRALFVGSTGNTAYYTPSGNNNPGTWAAGPTVPGGQGMPDAAGAMLPNGKILLAVSPTPTSGNHFPTPTAFYEFDYTTNTYTLVNAPAGGTSANISSYVTNMLVLPDGSVLYNQQGSTQYYDYSSSGSPLASGQPAVSNVTRNADGSYHLTGTLLNGIGEGAEYGDDWQMATNYPIVTLTNGTNVYHARTYNWSSTGVQTGSTPETTEFTLPAGLPANQYSLTVTANGITSAPFSFTTYSVVSSGGAGQSTTVNTAFGSIFSATVTSGGNPVAGVVVTFTAPSSGASGTFTGGLTTVTATTDSSGIARSPTFTANTVAGSYTVTASYNGFTGNFALTNLPGAATQLGITTQPFFVAAVNVPFSTQPVVAAEDAFGNLETTDSTHTVTASRGNLGTGALQGTTTVTLVGGVAIFSGLSYNTAETTNILFTTNAGGFTTTSNSIRVLATAPGVVTWTGLGVDSNWSNTANWQGGVAPAGLGTEDIVFPASPPGAALSNNDIVGGLFDSIAFQGGGYVVTGNAVTLSGSGNGGVGISNAGTNVYRLNTTLGASQTFTSASGTLVMTGTINENAKPLTITGAGNVLMTGVISGSVAAGSNALIKGLTASDTGTLTLNSSSSNTFTGITAINDGAVNIQQVQSLGSTNTVNIASAGTLQLQGGLTFTTTISLAGGGAIESVSGANTLSGNITLNKNASANQPANFNVDIDSLNLIGVISDLGSGMSLVLTKGGIGTLQLTGTTANTYAGGTTITAGILAINNLVAANAAAALGSTSGVVTVQNGATLQLTAGAGTTYSYPLRLSGNGFNHLGALITTTVVGSSATWSNTISLTGPTLMNAGYFFVVTGAIDTNGSASNDLTVISSTNTGFLANNPGFLSHLIVGNNMAYTGSVAGGIFRLSNNGSLTNAAGITVNPGNTLQIDNGNQTTDRVSDTGAVTLNGGTLSFIGRGGAGVTSAETIGSVIVNAGASAITSTSGSSGASAFLTISSLTRNAGSTVTFDGITTALGSATNQILLGTVNGQSPAGALINGIFPWAIVGTNSGSATDFASYNSGSATGLSALAGASYDTTLSDLTAGGDQRSRNFKLTNPGNFSIPSGTVINSLIIATNANLTITLGTGLGLTIGDSNVSGAVGAMLTATGNLGTPTIANGSLSFANEGVIHGLSSGFSFTTTSITGNAALTCTGLTSFSSAAGANTYSGGTTLAGGTLTVNAAATSLGSGPLTIINGVFAAGGSTPIVNNPIVLSGNASLSNGNTAWTFNAPVTLATDSSITYSGSTSSVTFNQAISDGGNAKTLSFLGNRPVTLNAASSHSGGTVIATTGTITVGSSNALGTGPVTLQAATATITSGSTGVSLPNSFVLTGSPTNLTVSGSNAITFGSLVPSGDQTLTVNNSSGLTVNALAGSGANNQGALTIAGSGTVSLPNAGTLGNGVTISSTGAVTVGNNNSFGSGPLAINGTATLTNINGATLTLPNSTTLGSAATFGTGSGLNFSGMVFLSATVALVVNNTTIFSGAVVESGGSRGLTLNGSGTLKLATGATYSGTTSINGGTLIVDGALVTGTITVNSGATLSGGGAINGAIVVAFGGTVAPGDSVGILRAGSADFSAGGNLRLQVTGVTGAGTNYDQVKIGGALTLGGSSSLILDLAGLSTSGVISAVTQYAGTLSGTSASVSLVNNPNSFQAYTDYSQAGSIIVTLSGAATQLLVATQPSTSATAGSPFGVQPIITELDQYGTIVATDSSHTVTVSRGSQGTAALQGSPLTVIFVHGVASFSGLAYNVAETINLKFITNAGSFTTTSNSIVVSPAAASQLAVVTQPPASVNALAGFGLAAAVEDAFGNVVSGYAGAVAVALANNPGASVLSGSLSASVSSGLASFSGLSLNNSGSGYTLQVSSTGLTSATSNPFVVQALSQTITFATLSSKNYGDAAFTISASASSGLAISFQIISGPATFDQATSKVTITGAGTIVVEASQSGNATYLSAAAVDRSFVAATAHLTVQANDASRAYGAGEPTFTATITGFVNGQTLATSGVTGNASFTSTDTASSHVGSYSIVPAIGTLAANNYDFTFANGQLIVTPVALSITANDQTKAYGAALPTLAVSYAGFVNGDTASSLATQPAVSTTATAASHVAGGPYAITASGAVDGDYTISYVAGQLTVTPVALSITADDQTKAYGAALPALTVSYAGFVNGDTADSLTTAPSVTTAATAASHIAGSPYAITASGAVDSDYTISFAPGALTVTPVALTITANNQSKAYGAVLPALTVSYTGFINGVTADSLTTAPTLTTTATAASHVANGPYAITASGAVDADYTISYVTGQLTVTPVALTITADDQTKPYGAVLPALTVTYAGLVNHDTADDLTTAPMVATTATAASHVTDSPYAITASGAVDADYTISYAPGQLTVTPVALTITADNQTKAYGAPLPALTVRYAGFVNNDTADDLTTAPTVTTTATAASHVADSPFAITASGAADADYTIGYVPGRLTVTPVALTITAEDQAKAYGADLPELTASYTGFVNDDTADDLTTEPTVTTTATGASHVADSPFAITASGAVDADYTISYVTGQLTVTPVALTVTADDQTKAYGAALPALTVSYAGFVNDDTADDLTTAPTVTTTATAASHVADSPFAITASGAVDADYTITYVTGHLTITSVSLTITANDQTKAYGAALPMLTVTYAGFVNGDTAGSLTTLPSVSTTATASSPQGTYPITASDAVDPDYSIVYVDGTLTILAPASHFTVEIANHAIAGTALDVTITALDASNGIVIGYAGTIEFVTTDNGNGVVLPDDYTFTPDDHGIHVFTGGVTLVTAASQSITATDTTTTSITGSATVLVAAGAADHLVFAQAPTDSAAGAPIHPAVVVNIVDAYGNLTASTGTVTISANGPGGFTTAGPGVTGSTTTATASGGVAAFNNLRLLGVGSYTLSATSTATSDTLASGSFNISGLAVTALTPTPSGFMVTFNQPFDPSPLNLYHSNCKRVWVHCWISSLIFRAAARVFRPVSNCEISWSHN